MVPLRPRLAPAEPVRPRAVAGARSRAGTFALVGLLIGFAASLAAARAATAERVSSPSTTPTAPVTPESGSDAIDRWLRQQAGVRTWSARFVQTRALKTLAQPLVSTGHVAFAAPNRFHWELGEPVQTRAIRQSNAVLIVYPALHRAERYPVDAAASGPWKQMLSLLEVGFPESRTQLEARFRVLSNTPVGNTRELTLEPRATAARRLMPRFRIVLAEPDLAIRATEMVFADGSSLRNEFSEIAINPPLDQHLFEPELGPDFKITEPLARSRP